MQLRLVVEYEGTSYQGWQLQPTGPTIQEILERALATALRESIRIRGAGRTDAGVHAWGQVVAAPVTSVPDDLDRLRRSLNALTPDDVAIREVTVVDDAFDPRRDASSRVYEYRILTTHAPSLFWRPWSWHFSRPLDADAMHAAAQALVGEHDFAALCGADPAAPDRTTMRRVLVSAVTREPPLLVYRVEATAFLKHMVRNIVGTLVEVGLGERPADSMLALLASRDRTQAGPTAPAIGLVLREVRYEGRSAPARPKS
ncbi:MAG TPA: tRNA pseudouridine(38-40) synthase TruA [Candidatus Binatia bacterium]|jgi:tRNA pseudouridine38-40 synthase|nr:tRNA pseudouridine(38-40) synthase TruA [Candidatus Binatia bacterium]